MLKQIIVFKATNLVAAFDAAGQPMPAEQGHLVELYCRALVGKGIVTDETTVHYYGTDQEVVDTTVGELMKRWRV